MDAAELATFTASLRRAAERHQLESHGADFDRVLEEIGWREALAEDPAAVRAVFAVQGELNLASSALDDVLLNAAGHSPGPETAILLSPAGTGTRRLLTASHVLVIHGHLAATVPSDSLTVRAVGGLDPDGEWAEVAAVPSLASLGQGQLLSDATLAIGRLAVATELTAATRAMLDLARTHALQRIQFGKPIATFQAVRHRLADALIATTSAEAAVDTAWDEASPYTATMAKAIAGRSARTVARHSQQVLAGMGFTSEHPFHRYLRRVLVLDQLLGSATELSTAMGQEAIRRRRIPAMLAL
jgi:alkylation response protein AidB-like acyl-CoA dehydrogenase